MLVVFQPLVTHFSALQGVWEVVDLLVQMKDLVINKPSGRLLLVLLYNLTANSEVYRQQRAAYVIVVFRAYLNSTVPANVAAAYLGLTALYKLKPKYDATEFAPILQHLKHATLAPFAIQLIARLADFPINDDLVYGLVRRSNENKLAGVVLLRLAASPVGAQLLLKYRQWYANVEQFPDETFRLVALLFAVPQNRQLFAVDPGFPALLKGFLKIADALVLSGLSRIFQFLPIDPEFVYELGDIGFLTAFADTAFKLNDAKSISVLIYIFTRIAAVAFLTEFVQVQAKLVPICTNPDYAPRILPLFCELAKFPSCAQGLTAAGVKAAIQPLSAQPDLAAAVQTLLSTLH